MPPQTEGWWCCSNCDEPLTKIGTRGFMKRITAHRLVCSKQTEMKPSCGTMKQIPKRKKT